MRMKKKRMIFPIEEQKSKRNKQFNYFILFLVSPRSAKHGWAVLY